MIPVKIKKNATLIFSLLIFICIIFVATNYISELTQTLRQVDIIWLLSGILSYFINYFFRAYRIRSYSNERLNLFPDTLRVSSLHGFISYFLPMRSGDLSLPALLKFYHGIPIIEGSRILLRARLMDLMSLGMLLTVATLFSAPEIDFYLRVIFFLTGVALTGVPYLFVFLFNLKKDLILRRLPWLSQIEQENFFYPTIKEIVQSLYIWFWTGCTIFCVIRSLGIPLAFLDVWFFATVQFPLQLLPIQGFANSGNHEMGWLITLNLLGIREGNTMAITISSHLIIILYVLLLGAAGALLPNRKE